MALAFAIAALYFFSQSAREGSDAPDAAQWKRTHTILTGLVLLCFSTEILVFGGVLVPFEKIGDAAIISRVVQNNLGPADGETTSA